MGSDTPIYADGVWLVAGDGCPIGMPHPDGVITLPAGDYTAEELRAIVDWFDSQAQEAPKP